MALTTVSVSPAASLCSVIRVVVIVTVDGPCGPPPLVGLLQSARETLLFQNALSCASNDRRGLHSVVDGLGVT